MIKKILALLSLGMIGLVLAPKNARAEPHPGAAKFADELAAELVGQNRVLTREDILATLARAEYRADIIALMKKPAESKSWKEYRPIFLTDARLNDGLAFAAKHRALLDCVEKDTGVPKEIILAIIGVETQYGKNIGKHRVIDALTTLALYYPPREVFFRSELKTILSLPPETFPQPIEELMGSYAGAMGWGQFMPSSYKNFAVDRDNDGAIDLWNSPADIIGSVGNYLAKHGWQKQQPIVTRAEFNEGATPPVLEKIDTPYTIADLNARGVKASQQRDENLRAGVLKLAGVEGDEHWMVHPNFKVITTYNRSPLYAMAVTQFAENLAARLPTRVADSH